jgi:hypothetical protein
VRNVEQRYEKVSLYRSDTDQTKGSLIAAGDTLRFESKKGTLTMPKVRNLELVKGRLNVEYGEPGTFGTATFVDLSNGALRWKAGTRDLEMKLRSVLQLVPVSSEEQPAYQQALSARKVASGKAGRTQMIIGGVVAVAATIVTIVTYANADPGDTYFVWWGGIIFGAILFFQGLAASRAARR